MLLDEHRTALLVESVVEEVLSEFISGEMCRVSRPTLGVGRARLAGALAQLQDVRGQGLSFPELAAKTAANHVTDNDYTKTLAELDERLLGLLSWPKLSVKAATKRDNFSNSGRKRAAISKRSPNTIS